MKPQFASCARVRSSPPNTSALRRIAKARGGIAKVAKAAGIERKSLYRALSAHGNPRLSNPGCRDQSSALKLIVEAAQ